MTTFEKEWTSKCISIEDPFELSHNLGSGISRKMANFIVKMLQRTRSFFGTFNENIFAEHNWNPDTRKLSKGRGKEFLPIFISKNFLISERKTCDLV